MVSPASFGLVMICGSGALARGLNVNRLAVRGLATSNFSNSLSADLEALKRLKAYFGDDTSQQRAQTFCDSLHNCIKNNGNVYTTGIGKAGLVAKRFNASLSSIGVPSAWVHGTEWVHGDLGALKSGDAVIAISHSGKTAELVGTFPGHLAARDVKLFAICSTADSPLGQAADEVVEAPASEELLGSVPSRSIVAQEAVCNAILTELVSATGYTDTDFGFNHPGGAIGAAIVK